MRMARSRTRCVTFSTSAGERSAEKSVGAASKEIRNRYGIRLNVRMGFNPWPGGSDYLEGTESLSNDFPPGHEGERAAKGPVCLGPWLLRGLSVAGADFLGGNFTCVKVFLDATFT